MTSRKVVDLFYKLRISEILLKATRLICYPQ